MPPAPNSLHDDDETYGVANSKIMFQSTLPRPRAGCLHNFGRNMNVSSAQQLQELAKPVVNGGISQTVQILYQDIYFFCINLNNMYFDIQIRQINVFMHLSLTLIDAIIQ